MPSSTTSPDNRILAVAVPVPGLGLLSYRVDGTGVVPAKGARVTVPLGSRLVTGVVAGVAAPSTARLKNIHAVIDDEPFLPEAVVDLALWVGTYYASGPGDALAIAMPPSARAGRPTAFRTVRIIEATPEGRAATDVRGPRQRDALSRLTAAPAGVAMADLALADIGHSTVQSLVRAGYARIREDVSERDPFSAMSGLSSRSLGQAQEPVRTGNMAPGTDRVLTPEQAVALAFIDERFQAHSSLPVLVQGVTGSGKTEVYLQLARRVVAAGRRVLMLVPEIALTPAVAGVFRARFGSRVAIQHSALSAGERHDQWHRIKRGEIDIVVGTRSAVFAPLERIGLIVVDEEHDASYKQDETPRYHGRDVAVVRGRMENALVLLGSATPSLESSANVDAGRYERVELRRRIFDRPLATVQIVDMREEYAARGPDVVVSTALAEAIRARLSRAEQTVVLLNRRGFATVVFCRRCATTSECPHCSVALTFHRAARRLRCHYCNYSMAVPTTCTVCGGAFLEQSGFGTERIEAELRALFPDARIARVDRDTIRRRGAITRVLDDVAEGKIDILVGTQMIAKGHDFPSVTLVGVISADVGLGMADFRAAERTFQLLTQVVGRAGRGAVAGQALIQTLYPDHYSIRAAAAQDYAAFYQQEREFREKLDYPPSVALINIVVKAKTAARAMTDAADLARRVRAHHPHGRVLGPAPAFLAKLKDEHRAQFFIKGRQRNAMRAALLAALDERLDLRKRTIVDIDPASVI